MREFRNLRELSPYLTREERIQRIGELLAKGISLMLQREAEEARNSGSQAPSNSAIAPAASVGNGNCSTATDLVDSDARAILDYFKRVGSASPRHIQRYLELSKATAFRRLDRLVKANLITRIARTTGIRYQLRKSGTDLSNRPRPATAAEPLEGVTRIETSQGNPANPARAGSEALPIDGTRNAANAELVNASVQAPKMQLNSACVSPAGDAPESATFEIPGFRT